AEHEASALLRVPIDATLAALATGAVRNGPLIVALQWLALTRRRLPRLAPPGALSRSPPPRAPPPRPAPESGWRPLANRSSHRARRHGLGVRASTRGSRVRCGRSGRHGLPLLDARAGSCRDGRHSRTDKSAVCPELPAVRYRGRFFRIGAYAAA